MSITMVPARSRPWRSQRPSLKRMPPCGCCTEVMGSCVSVPSSWGVSSATPVSMAATQRPCGVASLPAASAMQPVISGVGHWRAWPVPAFQHHSARPGMSTQNRHWRCASQTGLSPTPLRASTSSSACAVMAFRTDRP